jgi:hypothetical protein
VQWRHQDVDLLSRDSVGSDTRPYHQNWLMLAMRCHDKNYSRILTMKREGSALIGWRDFGAPPSDDRVRLDPATAKGESGEERLLMKGIYG